MTGLYKNRIPGFLKFCAEGYFGPHGHVFALLALPPPKARASRGAERAHVQRHPQGIRARQIPERMDCVCHGMEKSG